MTNFSHLNANGNVFWLKPHSKPGGEIRRIFHSALVKTNRKRVLVFENFIYELLCTWDLGQYYIQAQLNIPVYFRVMILFYSSWRNIIERSTLEGASSAGLNMVNWSVVCGYIVIFMQYFCLSGMDTSSGKFKPSLEFPNQCGNCLFTSESTELIYQDLPNTCILFLVFLVFFLVFFSFFTLFFLEEA